MKGIDGGMVSAHERKLSSSRFCLTRRREAAKLKMVFFAFFAASREIREVLKLLQALGEALDLSE